MPVSPVESPLRCGISRRELLRIGQSQLFAAPLLHVLGSPASAAEPPYLNRYSRAVHEYFVRQVRRAERRNERVKSQLASKADAEKYIESVRAKIRECFGPDPERTPLNPRVTGVLERDGYRIEKVIFDSRPNFPVTANLYLPTGHDKPVPGVIGSCGHSDLGKAAEDYQAFSQGLARLGFACLIFDPISQGERLQYPNDEHKSHIGNCVQEHLHAGNQQFLVGDFFGMWRAWDAMRALDYLLTRPEVDPTNVGITGNSGGGTMSTWLCGLDRRFTMAGVSCFITSFRRNLENELPGDTEQCPPKVIALGVEQEDFLLAMAPRPVVILAQELDFFDIRGTEDAYQRMKQVYSLLGEANEAELFIGPREHGYTQESREAMYRWFSRATGGPEVTSEPTLTIEKPEDLWCTPTGQVFELENVKTVFHFTREKAQALGRDRPKLNGESLRQAVREVLHMRPREHEPPDYRILRSRQGEGYPVSSVTDYAIETEPGIQAIVYYLPEKPWISRPPRGERSTLYISHLSSDLELREEPLLKELQAAEAERPIFTCDVRGMGESQPDTCGGPDAFHAAYGSDYLYAAYSIMLDRPYLGQKTFDVLRVLEWLQSYGYNEIHLVGKGRGALPATFAALLSDCVKRVTLKNCLTSFTDIAESERYAWPLSALLPNVLTRFDLPDCYGALAEKKLRILEPWGAEAKSVENPA
jgi:dienelactone hydrolase